MTRMTLIFSKSGKKILVDLLSPPTCEHVRKVVIERYGKATEAEINEMMNDMICIMSRQLKNISSPEIRQN